MRMKKVGVRLDPGIPVYFRTQGEAAPQAGCSITLVNFKVTESKVEWTLQTGDGKLVHGIAGTNSSLPLWEGSWAAISIPIQVHHFSANFSPRFVICMPDGFNPDFDFWRRA